MRARWSGGSTLYKGANHWPVLAQRPAHRALPVVTERDLRERRIAEVRIAEAMVLDAWSTGRWLADCRECLDFPRRFGTEAGRNLWADEHWAMTRHSVGVGHDMKGFDL